MATATTRSTDAFELLWQVELLRLRANRGINPARRSEYGQFMTVGSVAELMAGLLTANEPEVRLLDPGSGVGSLFAASVAQLCSRPKPPHSIEVVAFEIDPYLAGFVPATFRLCEAACNQRDIKFQGTLIQDDFIGSCVDWLADSLFDKCDREVEFNCAILNPPYKKINSLGQERSQLRKLGIETSNLYTAFMALTVKLLEPGGELVGITPRSFCNGSYFKPFRESFLREMELRHLHVFESRQKAFSDDDVLQENVILYATKPMESQQRRGNVTITSSADPDDEWPLTREIPYRQVVRPDDAEHFIHISPDDAGQCIADLFAALDCTLADLELTVSTGRVVDFRAEESLRDEAAADTVPLIWPGHFAQGYVAWPKVDFRKPNAIVADRDTRSLLVPNENYVLVRRFSSKEEKRRVVAAVYESRRFQCDLVGFENHLNYFHRGGRGLDVALARGLAVFLNSTLVDSYFRQFNGHTQVNATDLRNLRYPTIEKLLAMGATVSVVFPNQMEIDDRVREGLNMPEHGGIDPVKARQRIEEAHEVLKSLGLPRAQLNERSALTLLALLGLKPETPWAEATEPLCGITPMMDFFRDYYGKAYKPNTRETVRRQTVHQFLDAGLIVANPDQSERPINSPKAVYQIETSALKLLRTFGKKNWKRNLTAYLSTVQTLQSKYAQQRQISRIPISISPGKEITLSPGGQNVLVKEIIEEFAPRFTSPGLILYIGDTDERFAYFDEAGLAALGVVLEPHGKMPDVIVHYAEKNWLVLIEAVTSHGPIDPKRRAELKTLFGASSAGLVFVTAFLTRKVVMQYLDQISWETEVWIAETPSHMIHLNGKRFLGPYSE